MTIKLKVKVIHASYPRLICAVATDTQSITIWFIEIKKDLVDNHIVNDYDHKVILRGCLHVTGTKSHPGTTFVPGRNKFCLHANLIPV